MSTVSGIGLAGDVRRAARGPAWALCLSPVLFAALAVIAVGSGAGAMAGLTGAGLPTMAWVAFHVLYPTALGVGGWALTRVAGRVEVGWRRVVGGLVLGAVVAGVVTAVLRLVMLGAGDQLLGSLGIFPVALGSSVAAIWLAVAATAVLGLGLHRSGVLRRVGLVVAVLAGLHLVADVVTGGGLPPFVVSLWWLVLGIGLLRSRVPSA